MPATARYSSTQHNELFSSIAKDLVNQGYSVQHNALPLDLSNQLFEKIQNTSCSTKNEATNWFEPASNKSATDNKTKIINGDNRTEQYWINWSQELMSGLSQQLAMPLTSCNSHFSHYPAGTHCCEHLDATETNSTRAITLIAFLNQGWEYGHGGHLVIRNPQQRENSICIQPLFRTVVAFLSKEFPHAVLPTWRDRYSITSWFNHE